VASISVRIDGLDELLAKLRPDLYAEPLRKFWGRASITVQSRARELSPVDTGLLRTSILYEVDSAAPPMYAKVGSDVFYAPFQEFGTSRGVPAKHYLSGGFETSVGDIQHQVDVLGQEIVAAWGR
jgi:hypothetical protein